jgi:hypothetical protein
VQAPTKYELALNLKPAKAFGLEIPDKVRALADETAEVRLRRSARKEIGPASPALFLYSSERRPRPAWRRPAKRICKAQNNYPISSSSSWLP